jgi:hypothetical protein
MLAGGAARAQRPRTRAHGTTDELELLLGAFTHASAFDKCRDRRRQLVADERLGGGVR